MSENCLANFKGQVVKTQSRKNGQKVSNHEPLNAKANMNCQTLGDKCLNRGTDGSQHELEGDSRVGTLEQFHRLAVAEMTYLTKK